MSALAVSASMLPRLSGLARTKMQSVFSRGSREDSTGLHRWVLLKNSIVQSTPSLLASPPLSPVVVADEEAESLVHEYDEHDVFTFPLLDNDDVPPGGASESEWLDSLLGELEEDEDEMIMDDGAGLVPAPTGAEEAVYTPYSSPASSSENLVHAALCYAPPAIGAPYPIPYPPLTTCVSAPVYADELDDLPVPDAIEDTSDDESDAPATPSSTASSLASLVEQHRRAHPREPARHQGPHIVLDADDDALFARPFDPLPFAEEPHNPPDLFATYSYQEC